MKNLIKTLKTNKAFTAIELLIVLVILVILLLLIPNLDLFVENAIKKEGVLLARTIIEQERVYKADNGYYLIEENGDSHDIKIKKIKEIHNWKPVKTLLLENKYFRPENSDTGKTTFDSKGNINIESANHKIIELPTKGQGNCKFEVVIKASDISRANGWYIKGQLIEEKNKKPVLKFKNKHEKKTGDVWEDISI